MIGSLWDLKLTILNDTDDTNFVYHDRFPMGFETHSLDEISEKMKAIMIGSLWDLKRYFVLF